jgi:hypothetical protein
MGAKVPGRRLATPVAAVKNKHERGSAPPVEGRCSGTPQTAAARPRSRESDNGTIDSAAFVSTAHVRAPYATAVRLAPSARAPDREGGRRVAHNAMVAERETITQHAYHGFVVLAPGPLPM